MSYAVSALEKEANAMQELDQTFMRAIMRAPPCYDFCAPRSINQEDPHDSIDSFPRRARGIPRGPNATSYRVGDKVKIIDKKLTRR